MGGHRDSMAEHLFQGLCTDWYSPSHVELLLFAGLKEVPHDIRFLRVMEEYPIRNIRVAYSDFPPFVSAEEDDDGKTVIGGFMYAIMQAVTQWMNVSVTLIREPDNQYGSFVDGNWTGMCGMLFRNEVDALLNPIMPQENFAEIAFYTTPVIVEAFTTLSGKKKQEAGLFVYFNVLSPIVWGGVGISLLLIATTSMLVYKNVLLTPPHVTWLQTWLEYVWFFFTSMLSQGPNEKWVQRENKSLVSTLLSLLTTLWAIGIAFLVMNVFQTQLVSKLTIVKSVPLVKTLEDFANKVKIHATTAKEIEIHEILEDSGIPLFDKVWLRVKDNMMMMDELFSHSVLDDVESGKTALIHGHLILEDVLKARFEERGTCNFYMAEQYFFPFPLLMALKKTLPKSFLNKYNYGMTRVLGADLTGKWFKPIREGFRLCSSYQDNTMKPLSLDNIHGVLILWACGLSTALATLGCEILCCKLKTRRKKKQRSSDSFEDRTSRVSVQNT